MTPNQRQEFCVRWNSHLGSIGAAFPQLLAGQRFVDVTLACEGQQVHCHRLVLAACSSYFESLLAENPCKHPVIIMPSEIKLWEIQALVDFMYKGEVNVTQAGLPQLLRCAEQLRIRGLYGSDAALNVNQLKAYKAAANAAAPIINNSTSNLVNNDSIETDDTATNSTSTTNTSTMAQLQQLQQQQLQQLQTQMTSNIVIKKEFSHSNGIDTATHEQLPANEQTNQKVMQSSAVSALSEDEDSAEDSTSNSNEQYDTTTSNAYAQQAQQARAVAFAAAAAAMGKTQHDTAVDEDHNYVSGAAVGSVADDNDSYGADDADLESSLNSNANSLMDNTGSLKRVRRSEASLAQAAKCVSKGQTFQTVSNMFNIPVSTIRFYMARKGILPKRKRGRGASTSINLGSMRNNASDSAVNALSHSAMSEAMVQIKQQQPDSPTSMEQSFLMMGYKSEQGAV